MAMMRGAIKLLFTFMITVVVNGIYPSDHWKYSKKLTEGNFDSTIQKEIDAGKTFFVRWIASPG